jgi:putative ABC transport system ATP-binding protein
LLYMLGGMESPSSGTILLNGIDLTSLNEERRAQLRRGQIGFIFQTFNLLPTLTVEENVAIPSQLNGISETESCKCAAEMLGLVGMSHRQSHFPSSLSGGEQQRVAIARALAIRPALLLADEPTGNLDSANGRQVVELLRTLVDEQKQTLVMVTHDANVAGAADRVVHLCDGLIEREEAPASLKNSGGKDFP